MAGLLSVNFKLNKYSLVFEIHNVKIKLQNKHQV